MLRWAAILLLVLLVAYNLWRGYVMQEFGIPGVFTFKFGKPDNGKPGPERTRSGGGGQVRPDDTSTYGFEDETREVMGWKGSGAVISLKRSSEAHRAHSGRASLELGLRFDDQNPALHAGQASVRIDVNPHTGVQEDPVDLSKKTLEMFLMLPDFPINEHNPHGLQVFVKDAKKYSLYGCWKGIDLAGTWIRMRLVSAEQADKQCGAHKDASFDATRVEEIGIKISLNPNAPTKYEGAAYLDAVRW
jgi:hypothetical protein